MTITNAKKDGYNFALIACNRITPAHSTIAAVFCGFIDVHAPFESSEFKREFFKSIGVCDEK